MYLIKIGNDYLGADGVLTPHQKDAQRVELPDAQTPARLVHLRPHGTPAGHVDTEAARD